MLAYIDGTTGGMMLQLLLASLVGGFVTLKLVARGLVSTVFRRRSGEADEEDPEDVVPWADRPERPR